MAASFDISFALRHSRASKSTLAFFPLSVEKYETPYRWVLCLTYYFIVWEDVVSFPHNTALGNLKANSGGDAPSGTDEKNHLGPKTRYGVTPTVDSQ